MTKNTDLSWLWHCTSNTDNMMDYGEFITDTKNTKLSPAIIEALNKAYVTGFRSAMRKVEDLNIITMDDIDRKPSESDQNTWDELFNES